MAVELLAIHPLQAQGRVGDLDTAVADLDEYDPVLGVPVEDRRQIEVVEAVPRHLDRLDVQADPPAGDGERAQRRARLVSPRHLPEPGHGHVHAVPAGDHRQAGDTTIGLVDLLDHGELPLAAAPSFALPGGRRHLELRQSRGRVLGNATGQDLLREVERDAGFLEIVPAGGLLVHTPGEGRVLLRQASEGVAVERQQASVGDRSYRGDTRLARDEGPLAEDVAGPHEADRKLAVPRPGRRLEPPVLDEVHGPARLTLGDEDRPSRDLYGPKLRVHGGGGLERQVLERRVRAEEAVEHLHPRLVAESATDLGMQLQQGVEDDAVEPQRGHGLRGAHRGRSGGLVQDRRFSEPVARLQARQGHLPAVVHHQHAGAAGGEHVHAVGHLALGHDRVAEAERAQLE